jgi:hypothetical protein
MTAGPPEIQSTPVDCLGPSWRRIALLENEGYMTSSSTIHVSAGHSRIAILHDKLRLTLGFRARLPEIDDVRNSLMTHAAIGSQEEHGCSKEHAP